MTGVYASISQLLDWNVDPFDQDVQQVLTNNNITINKEDIAPTAPLSLIVSLFSFKNSSFPSCLKNFSSELNLYQEIPELCFI